ncbi:MAG: hypothetical protein FVQ83_16395 [Chloroflexi bacterium]|nr:hypothetical protein [Chloroflexota bacterium]
METNAGYTLIIGAVLLIGATFLPINRIYMLKTVEEKLGFIKQHPRGWSTASVIYILAGILTAVGMMMTSQLLGDTPGRTLGYVGLLFLILAEVAWIWAVALRFGNPEPYLESSTNIWQMPASMVLMIVALTFYGLAFLKTGYPSWLGYGLVGVDAVFMVWFLIAKDVYPGFFYMLTLVIGIVLLKGV